MKNVIGPRTVASPTSGLIHSRSLLLLIICMTSAVAGFSCRSNMLTNFSTIDRFTDNMCAQCLWYMAGSETPWTNFEQVNRWVVKYNHSEEVSVLVCTPTCHAFSYQALADAAKGRAKGTEKNITLEIMHAFKSLYYLDLLLDCCEKARECCSEMERAHADSGNDKSEGCPAKWDGFMCWPSARNGSLNHRSCPSMTYVPLSVKPSTCRDEMAEKECWANGSWSTIWKWAEWDNGTRYYYAEEFTNYMQCSTPGATHRLSFIRVSTYVNIVSLVLTIGGLGVLLHFGPKKQQSSRNLATIHANFLVSLILTTSLSIMVLVLIKEPHYRLNSMIDDNPFWCRLLIVGKKAARLTNYCWMLNEGVILTQMIVTALKRINMLKFYLIGWLLPAIIMAAYTAVHWRPEYNTGCWTKSMGYLEHIYNIPPIAFIFTNIICLVYIVYILIRKLTSTEDTSYLWSGVKASLVMIPVFGIQYAFYIVPFDPLESCTNFLFSAQYLLLVLEALQGAIVAIIFCFLNKDVQQNIKRRLQIRKYLQNYRTRSRNEAMELARNIRR